MKFTASVPSGVGVSESEADSDSDEEESLSLSTLSRGGRGVTFSKEETEQPIAVKKHRQERESNNAFNDFFINAP